MIEFRKIDDADPTLAHSPMVRAMEKTFAYLDEHGGIGLTPSKAFKRTFVHWAAAEFDWPGHTETDLFAVNKVLNEQDFMPLVDIHFLMTTLKIGRHHKGQFKLTKSGQELADQPGRLFGIITPFYLFEIDHSYGSRLAKPGLPGNWDSYLNVLNVETENGATGAEIRRVLFGDPEPSTFPRYDEVMGGLYGQVLRPLVWTGLLQETRPERSFRSQDAIYTKTPLWKVALKLDTDSLVQPATRH